MAPATPRIAMTYGAPSPPTIFRTTIDSTVNRITPISPGRDLGGSLSIDLSTGRTKSRFLRTRDGVAVAMNASGMRGAAGRPGKGTGKREVRTESTGGTRKRPESQNMDRKGSAADA